MNAEHPISNEVLDLAELALMRGEHFMAYNNSLYFIDKEDVHFFKREEDAVSFAYDNSGDYDRFNVIAFHCISDILRHIPYGEQLVQVKLDPDANGLYNKEGNGFTDALIEHFESSQLSLFNKQSKNNFMNQQNLDYLKNHLKYMGFGDKLYEQLEKELRKGEPNFQLNFEGEINNKAFAAVLNFRKSDTSDMYFFNSYHATLERKNSESVDQTFYLKDGKGITAKEAFNLLDGRAVHKELTNKEGQSYNAWVQIDFDKRDNNNNHEVKQFHQNYGYDLKEAVGKFAILELDGGEKEKALMQSLQKGNMQAVNMEIGGETKKMFIEANPQFKTVNLYDDNLKRTPKEELKKYMGKGSAEIQIVKQETLGDNTAKSQGSEKSSGKEEKRSASKDVTKENTPAPEGVKKNRIKKGKDLMPQKPKSGLSKGVKIH